MQKQLLNDWLKPLTSAKEDAQQELQKVREADEPLCCQPQKAGILKFFCSNGTSFYFHVCGKCWTEIIAASGVHTLVIAQVPQPVTS